MSLSYVTGRFLWTLVMAISVWYFLCSLEFCIAIFTFEVTVTSSNLYYLSSEEKYLQSVLLDTLRLSQMLYEWPPPPFWCRAKLIQCTRTAAYKFFCFPEGSITSQVCGLFMVLLVVSSYLTKLAFAHWPWEHAQYIGYRESCVCGWGMWVPEGAHRPIEGICGLFTSSSWGGFLMESTV